MTIETWLLYLIASIGLSLTPGPNGLLALTHGTIYGARRSTYTISGGVLGFAILMGVSMIGLGTLLIASQQGFLLAKLIGAFYLVYLGVKTWRSPPPSVNCPQQQNTKSLTSNKALFSHGFLVAISNPKAIIFFAAFLPQFIDTAAPQFLQFIILAGTFATTEFMVEFLLAGSANKLIPWLSRGNVGKWFNRITGAAFIGLGGFLVTVHRTS